MYQLPMSNHVAALQFVIPSPPICWQKLAKEYFKKTKRRAKPVLLSQLLATYMVKKRNPFKPQVMGKPPHMVIVNVPDQARTIPPVVYNFIILYVPTIIQLLLLSKII
jgi:hypothetical protein